ncbi:type I-E CRISPR-associated protein Cas5/CasD [Flaviflexus equikiangi]|uniref:type I-E CRISPR-associated protein Cas5/CasD n=1 Tax=Flaviflexus equikiangi TaxID=2758573 RepID=UPI0015F66748|nr:type I-E CRISPR-associated protein Cas5/CasD [Flaviflexus equikiangi]
MSTLILRASGPMQSWAVNSRYSTRESGREPSKSGIVGLLAAALGRSREEDVTDLVALTIGTRTDQPGRLLVDYHTAKARGDKHSTLSWRHYLSDAAFSIAISGESGLIETLAEAVVAPRFPLYLGRRACPVPVDFVGGVYDENDVETVLRDFDIAPWLATEWYRKEAQKYLYLPLSRDARPGEEGEIVRDVPRSFSPSDRNYDSRKVVRCEPVRVDNPDGVEIDDPFFTLVKES